MNVNGLAYLGGYSSGTKLDEYSGKADFDKRCTAYMDTSATRSYPYHSN